WMQSSIAVSSTEATSRLQPSAREARSGICSGSSAGGTSPTNEERGERRAAFIVRPIEQSAHQSVERSRRRRSDDGVLRIANRRVESFASSRRGHRSARAGPRARGLHGGGTPPDRSPRAKGRKLADERSRAARFEDPARHGA